MHISLRLATLALLLHANALFAQAIPAEPVLNCGANEKMEALRLADPAYRQKEEQLEKAWSAYAQKGPAAEKSNPPPFTLPIVFHIVHENGAENISNAAVERGLDYANQAFANIGYYDQGTGVNTQIQFCLARRDPDNNPTNGINRIVSPLTNLDSNDDRDLKDLSRWNTRDYINVWVVREICGLGLGCGVAGYAYYPSAHGSGIDGIVMEARWLAGDEAAAGVLIHELGHYLGLRHTFDGGCTNDDCTRDGDAVCDTPPDQSKAAVPCTGTANSCTTDVNSGFATDQNDMFINYMDYGHFRCYSAFTAGQRDRMHFFIDGIRRSLLDSRGCQDPCPALVAANFSGGDVTVDVGTTINFTNLSSNGDRYTWTEGNTIFSTAFNASRTFNTSGTYRITLLVESDDDLCQSATFTQTVRVVCPVTASFDVPALVYVNVGDTLRNTSTSATTFRWTVDGAQVSTAEDFPFTFTATGLRRVCLETSNGLCGANYCRSVFVREPPCTGPGCGGSDADDCGEAFAYAYEQPGGQAEGHLSCVVPATGGFFAGGDLNGQPLVMLINGDGTSDWQTQLFPPGFNGTVTAMIIDQNGLLAGIGYTSGDESPRAFAFQMDPADGSVIWANAYGGQLGSQAVGPLFTSLFHTSPSAPYTLLGSTDQTNITAGQPSATFFQLATADGALGAVNVRYSDGSQSRFVDAVYDATSGLFYAVGSSNGAAGGSSPLLVALNTAGVVQWAKRLNDFNGGTTEGLSIDLDGGDLVVLTTNAATNPASGKAFRLWKTDLLGNTTWVRQLTPVEAFAPERVRVNPNGYLLLGNNTGTIRQCLIQTGRDGIGLWAQAYDNQLGLTRFPADRLRVDVDRILMPTSLEPGFSVPALLRLGPDGNPPGECPQGGPLELEESQLQARSIDQQLGTQAFQMEREDFFYEPTFLALNPESCRDTCLTPPVEICDNGIDDDDDGFVDCEDPDLATDCCCLDSLTVDLGPDARLCPGELLGAQTNRNGVTYLWSTGATTDSIVIDQPGTYWVAVTDSCGNMASDTLTLHLRPRPNLQLGPDTVLCSNAVIPLLAQDGFARYEWVDGSTEKRFTAYDAGTYWVVATDSCGGVQRDTVRVSINPVTEIDLGRDTTICPGDTLRFQLSGFSNYQWSQSSFIDCTNCPEIRFAPTADTLLLVSADLGPGCISSDSIRVRIFPLAGLRDSAFLCPGDSVLFGENTLFSAGQYLAVQTVNGCERTDTLDVFELPETLLRDTVQACPGTAVDIFGTPTTQAGEYRQTFTAANGCDSTVVVRLEILEAPLRSDTLRICQGDSVLLFGQFRRTAGLYEDQQTAANGCDSTHRVLLEVANLTISTRELNPDCGGAAAGAGEVLVNSNGRPFVVRWNTGDLTNSIVGLPAGDYSVTVTTDDACSATETLTINSATFRPISISADAETCPGENDGLLRISGGSAGDSYSLDGGTTVFQDSLRTGLAPGNYELWATDTQGCTQQLAFSVGAAAPLFINLPADQSIRFGDSINVAPISNLPAGVSLTWGSSLGDSCRACPSLTLRPISTVVVSVTMSDDRACVATDETTIRVLRDKLFYVPNAFSPNGDGVNDFFRFFPGPAVERILSLAVYDRWGGRVFLAEDRDPEDALAAWDGTLPGRDPNLGVYVYVVEVRLFTGEVVKEAGEVMVLR